MLGNGVMNGTFYETYMAALMKEASNIIKKEERNNDQWTNPSF